jgi:NADPH:quinone reductase
MAPPRSSAVRAAVYDTTGPPEVLHYAEVPDPVAGPGEVLVRVEAISIEGGDTLNRAGGDMARVPHIVGYQCAGTVIDAGPDVAHLKVGDAVTTVGLDGSHAELRAVPEGFCWLIPEGLSVEEAACVPVPFGTADDCLFEFGRLQAGETALIQAGASGVGIAAVQLAKRAGARVLATASRPDKLERLEALGMDVGIDYTATDFVAEVRRVTEGRGADVIVDSVGGRTLQGSLRALAYRGRCISVGDAGRDGGEPVTGYFLGAELIMSARPRATIARLLSEIAAGALQVVIDRRFPLSEAAAAHAFIESRQAFGRVLLIP